MDPPSAPQLLPKGVRQACNWTLSPLLLSLVSGCHVTVAHHLSFQILCTSQSPLCERFLFCSVFAPCLVPLPQKNPVLSWPSQIETNSLGLPGQHHKQYLVAGPHGQPPSRFWGLDSQGIPWTSGFIEIDGCLTVTVLAGPEVVLGHTWHSSEVQVIFCVCVCHGL